MPRIPVYRYGLGYDIQKHQFSFYYGVDLKGGATQIFVTAQEFMALADMFRNEEGVIEFDTDTQSFITALKSLHVPPRI